MPLPEKLIRQTGTLVPETIKERVKTALGVPGIESSLVNMKRNGFSPAVAIDVGAFKGDWTRLFKRVFPDSCVLMVEPQASRQRDLQTVSGELTGVELSTALLGEANKESVLFHQSGSASSVLPEIERDAPACSMPMTTLDNITNETRFAQPDFVKLDVQGYELSVLRGAEKTLEGVEAVLMEINLIPIYRDVPLFHDVTAFMAERDFRLYDICTFFRRPYDAALWQLDAIFVRASSQLLVSNKWA